MPIDFALSPSVSGILQAQIPIMSKVKPNICPRVNISAVTSHPAALKNAVPKNMPARPLIANYSLNFKYCS